MKKMTLQSLKHLFLILTLLVCGFQSSTLLAQTAKDSVIYKTGYITVNGAKLFYREAGEGHPMLFVHGATGTSQRHFGTLIDEFAKKNRVIAIDLRGHGRSNLPDEDFSINLFTEDVSKFLEELKLDSITYIGFSLGGMIGFNLAVTHPEKVKKLITIGAVANHEGFKYDAIDNVRSWLSDDMTKYLKSSFTDNPNPEKIPDYQKKITTMVINQNEPKLSEKAIKKIKCPTLLICGDTDGFIKIEHQVYLFNTIAISDLLILPKTGHAAHLIQPVIVNKAIWDFMGR